MGKCSRFIMLMAGVSTIALASPALAQAPADDAEMSEDIIVTGSRIARTTFQTPTPVTAISTEQLEAKAATSVIDMLRDIPALRPNRTSGSGRNIGVSNFNMRSLGASRTLVLLDGQRLMDSSPVGGFDLNVIPAPLIARMDIVTAGASSVYGSDAVTGVVNVILNNDLDGGKIDAQYSVSAEGDKETVSASLAWGTDFAGDRGHFVIGASYVDSPDLLLQGARDWGSQGYTLIPNGAYAPGNGQFRQLIVPNVRLSNMTYGGLITSAGPLKNVQFGPGGEQSLFQQGSNVSTVWMQGGDGLMLQGELGALIPASKQESLFTRATFDVTPEIEARFDLLATRSRNQSVNNYNYNNGDITVRLENPYLPDNIRQTMIDNGLQTITMGRLNPEMGVNTNISRNHYYRAGAGLRGPMFGDWTWELGANYTYALAENEGHNNRIQANWSRALDVVTGPNGQPMCRSTLTAPDNGCVPANIFGLGSLSQAVVDYASGTSWQDSYARSGSVNANITGTLGATWAGPISVAGGVEYREDHINSKSDPISNVNGWRQGTFASFRGEVSVSEVYGEASIPLAADSPLARNLDLDLAARYVDYSTSGEADVWKIGLNWALNDIVRFRSTYSKDFRAPKLDDLFAASSLRAGNTVLDFQTGTTANVNTITGGNPNLRPEIGYTVTAGVVLSDMLPGLMLSADYFDIELEDALSLFSAQEVVDRCGGGAQNFCDGIMRNSSGVITDVRTTLFNAQVLKTRGVDFEASFSFDADALFSTWDGDFELRGVATYVDRMITTTGGPEIDTAGQITGTNGTPKWRGVATVTYSNGPLALRTLFNYVHEGVYNTTYGPFELNTNEFPSYLYTDVSAQYDVTEQVQFYAKIENLFDKDPPLVATNTITIAAAASSPFYDVMGRLYGVGIRYRW